MEILIAGGGYIGMYTARRLERLLRRGEATVEMMSDRRSLRRAAPVCRCLLRPGGC